MSTVPDWARRGRAGWRFDGRERPSFAFAPRKDQESVWDYPRPPRLERDTRSVVVRHEGVPIAQTSRAVRVLETASPPTFYLPPNDVDTHRLTPAHGSSLCEWKGEARYWSIVADGTVVDAVAWSYPDPFPEFETLRGYLSFYPGRVECFVDGVRVAPQPGGFYGGWVTPDVVGPFKGEPGTGGW